MTETGELKTYIRWDPSSSGTRGWEMREDMYGDEKVLWQEQENKHGNHAVVAGYACNDLYVQDDRKDGIVDIETVPDNDREEIREMVAEASKLGVSKEKVFFW